MDCPNNNPKYITLKNCISCNTASYIINLSVVCYAKATVCDFNNDQENQNAIPDIYKMKINSLINILLLGLPLVIIVSCKSKDGDTNKIKSIRLITYFVDNKSSEVKEGSLFTDETYEYDSSFNLVKDRFVTYKYDFDKYGYKIMKYSYNGSGGIFQTDVYKNDSAGNPIEILDYDYKMKDIEHKTSLKYSVAGDLINKLVYDESDSLIESCNYEYDNKKFEVKRNTSKYGFVFFKYAYQYDNQNRILEKTTYTNGNEVSQKILYEYDYAGNKIKETIYTLNEAEELSVDDRRSFRYDKANKLVKETHIMDGTEYQTTYEYNESGKLSKEASSEREILYSYDNNTKITRICIKKNKKQWWKEEDFYDSNGNKIQSIHYDDSNRINNRYFYKYNKKNHMVVDSCVDLDGILSFMNKFLYKNDTLRLKLSVSSHWLLSSEQGFPGWVETGDGKFEYTTYQTLDKFGNVIEELIDYILLQELAFEYKEFDSKGNWTSRIVKEFGKPYRIEKREIKYY